MRKIAIIVAAAGFLISALPAFAAVHYSRTPGGSSGDTMTVNVSMDSFSDVCFTFVDPSCVSDWSIVVGQGYGEMKSASFSHTTLSGSLTVNYGDVSGNYITWIGLYGANGWGGSRQILEGDRPGTDIFDFTAPPAPPAPAGLIPIPPNFGSSLTANVSSQAGDQGTLLMIGVAAGVPLVFYVIEQLVGLVPRKRR